VRVHQADRVGLVEDRLRPAGGAVELPRDRTDLPLGKVMGQLAKALLFVGEREVDHWWLLGEVSALD